MRLAVIGVVFFGAIMTLLVLGLQAGSIPHYTIDGVRSAAYRGEECRVDGARIKSIESLVDPLRFTVVSENGDVLEVVSKRHPPDNFKVGNGVGMKGYYRAERAVFEANDITTSCPSKYEGATKKSYGGEPGAAPRDFDIQPES